MAEKLAKIAEDTHRKKSYFVNKALQEYFDEIEDLELALERRGGNLNRFKRPSRNSVFSRMMVQRR